MIYYPQRSKSMGSGEYHVTIPTSAPASVRVENICSVAGATGLISSASSDAIPSTTTKHEQVPTSITKKHSTMCYRLGTANVGWRMVLGRIYVTRDGTTLNGPKSLMECMPVNMSSTEDSVELTATCDAFPSVVIAFYQGFRGGITRETQPNVGCVGFMSASRRR